MLVFTRKEEESFIIGDPGSGFTITVKVLEISGSQVKLGIVAPADIPVNREEIYIKKFPTAGTTDAKDAA